MSKPKNHFLPLEERLPALAGDGWRRWTRDRVESALGLPEVRRRLDLMAERIEGGEATFDALLGAMEMKVDGEGVMESVPPEGPLTVIANHPFGGPDAAAVAALLMRVRDDVQVLGNSELERLPGFGPNLLPLEILGAPGAERANLKVLRRAIRHLSDGGSLLVFPAGAVSHWRWESAEVEDPPWPLHTARIVSKSGSPVLPVRVFGQNGPLFQLLGACHPLLRSALILRAFLAKRGKTIHCRAGKLLHSSDLPWEAEALSGVLRQAVEAVLPGEGI